MYLQITDKPASKDGFVSNLGLPVWGPFLWFFCRKRPAINTENVVRSIYIVYIRENRARLGVCDYFFKNDAKTIDFAVFL